VPTLTGTSGSWLARLPSLRIAGDGRDLEVRDVDFAVMRSELSGVLSRAVGEPVHGLLGYSLLRRYRVAVDYPRRVMWLDPLPRGWDDKPYEYSHIGLQLERVDGAARVLAVADGSPAAVAGIAVGDDLLSVDGNSADQSDIVSLTRSLEGPPGTRVTIKIRRGAAERTYSLIRRQLL
jgi:S1-C subfamily serine protease